jgi:hypothetical protein
MFIMKIILSQEEEAVFEKISYGTTLGGPCCPQSTGSLGAETNQTTIAGNHHRIS